MKKIRGVVAVVAGLLASNAAMAGAILYVDQAATGANNGLTWANAFTNLQAAIDAAAGITNTLWVAQGTYQNTYDPSNSFVIAKTAFSIYGGFTNGMLTLAERNWTNYPTLLDGANARRVLSINTSASTIVLDSLTLQRGRLLDTPGGGGIRANLTGGGNALTLRQCRILNNASTTDARSGAGLYAANVNVTIDECLFGTNSTYGRNDNRAGGIYLTGGSLTVRDSTFVANKSGHHNNSKCGGGAGWILSAPALFTNCVFRGNTANSSARPENAYGGALYFAIGANQATIRNCVFAENTGYHGGAITVDNGTVNLRNCTVAGNSALGASTQQGGALYLGGGAVNATDSILWGNLAVAGKVAYCLGTGSASFDYCDVDGVDIAYFDGNTTVSNVLTNDPSFAAAYTHVRLKSTAGRWDPATAAWVNDAVLSPCIDAGNPVSDFSKEPPGANGGRVNLGAYGNTARASKSPAAIMPQVENRSPSAFQTTAVMRGELVAGTPSDIRILYGTNSANLDLSFTMPFRQSTGAVFSVAFGDLKPNAQYWYGCVASNAAGVHTNDSYQTFTTTTATSGGADIIHVDKDAPSPAETGRDWGNAFKTVKGALAAVKGATNTLWVAQGTYQDGSVASIAASANVYGGFTNGMTAFAQRDAAAYPTILDGKNLHRLLAITANGLTVLLDGLTLKRGNALDSPGGGAILANRTGTGNALTLRNCQVLNNTIGADSLCGAGLYAAYENVTIDNCWLQGNSLSRNDARGGAIYLNYGSLTVRDSSFIANLGGHHNNTVSGGGAGWMLNAPVTFTNCVFLNNKSISSSQNTLRGGALYFNIPSKTATLVNCLFAGSVCNYHGGAIAVDSGAVNIRNATFTTNSAAQWGGAIYLGGGTVSLINSILWRNSATTDGKELYATGASSTLNGSYSLITETNAPYVVATNSASVVLVSSGLIVGEDPLFASATDLHLKSRGSRWDPVALMWVKDTVTSPAIDAGDPTDTGWRLEPWPNGGRINMGVYGGTPFASNPFYAFGILFTIR